MRRNFIIFLSLCILFELIWLFWIENSILLRLYDSLSITHHSGIFTAILGATATIITISLPITTDIISRVTDKYEIPDIAQHFTRRIWYRIQLVNIFILLIFALILLYVPEDSPYSLFQKDIVLLGVLLFIGVVVSFFFYIRMVTRFIISNEIEDAISEHSRTQAEESI